MKLNITLISTILIAFATIGFVILPELYDEKIDYLIEKNDSLKIQQNEAKNWGLLANSQKGLYFLLSDHLLLYNSLIRNKKVFETKEKLIIKTVRNAALYTINASKSAGCLTRRSF